MRLDDDRIAECLGRLRVPGETPADCQRAAVMLLLVDRPETTILTIEKTRTTGYRWAGQIALPGGHIQPSDASPISAAFRELKEELGIPESTVRLLGELGHFQTEHSRCDLHVFVGRWHEPGPLRLDAREVARVVEYDLEAMLREHENRRFRGRAAKDLGQDLRYGPEELCLWGVTARICHALIECVVPPTGPAIIPEVSTVNRLPSMPRQDLTDQCDARDIRHL